MNQGYGVKGRYLWDLWFIKSKGEYHVFYLQSRKTKNPEERHDAHVSIGHAISKDLVNWKKLPTPLRPGKKGEWDDLALWTGSIIKKGKTYYLYYTGRKKDENQWWIQRIGLATSQDLVHWQKYDKNPILEADPRFYFMKNEKNRLGKISAWRDPYVFRDPKTGKYYKTISARTKSRAKEYNACIALAESDDLVNWKTQPPILSPGIYDEMETPQIIFHNGLYYLFFSVFWDENFKPSWVKKNGIRPGLHCYYSRDLLKGYKPVNKNGVVSDNARELYDIRLLHKRGDEYTALGWLDNDKKGRFIGKLSLPFNIIISGDSVTKKVKELDKLKLPTH